MDERAFIEEAEGESLDLESEEDIDLDEIRPDLQRIMDRLDTTYDRSRQWAVERRRARGQRTTRESIGQLLDDDEPFLEYGQLVLAAQRQRRSLEPGRSIQLHSSSKHALCPLGSTHLSALPIVANAAIVVNIHISIKGAFQFGGELWDNGPT